MEDQNNQKDSRRKFLNNGWKLGLASILGAGALAHLKDGFASEGSGETIELMDTEGNIIEVDASQVEEMMASTGAHDVRRGMPGRKFVMVVDLASSLQLQGEVLASGGVLDRGGHVHRPLGAARAADTIPPRRGDEAVAVIGNRLADLRDVFGRDHQCAVTVGIDQFAAFDGG